MSGHADRLHRLSAAISPARASNGLSSNLHSIQTMTAPLVFMTGFGPFEGVTLNPSGRTALALAADPPPEVRITAVELPVTFEGSGAQIEVELERTTPDCLLSLGVHRGSSFRLEARARNRLGSGRPDNAGVTGTAVELDGPGELRTSFDLTGLEGLLRDAGAAEVTQSEDAGGYVCERVYRAILEHGERLAIPALFLHVPPVDFVPIERQVEIVRAFVNALAKRLPNRSA